jgi:hypothetical protein
MLVYTTDVEGRWEKLASFARDNPYVHLVDGRLGIAPGATFVFGGDAIDRGPDGRRLVATLLDAKRRHGDRVVLLAGNRDINKLRLRRELAGFPPARAPEDVRAHRPTLLRWIFANTMGTKGAFEHRHAELLAEGRAAADEDVVESFLADLAPDGVLTAYLRECCLAWRAGATLFVHGGVTDESVGAVPDRGRLDDVDRWIAELNRFYAEQIDAYQTGTMGPDGPGWAALVRYQAPVPGTRANQGSVVYGRTANEDNDPRLPEPAAIERLLRDGVERVILGHTPAGDVPSALRHGRFVLLMADNSHGRVETGSQVFVDGDRLSFAGRCKLDDGRVVDVRATVEPPVGLCTADSGHLVKARLEAGWLLFRALPGYRTEQIEGSIEGRPLGAPRSLP